LIRGERGWGESHRLGIVRGVSPTDPIAVLRGAVSSSVAAPSVRTLAGAALAEPNLDAKFAMVADVARRWQAGELGAGPAERLVHVDAVGRPDRPELVGLRELPPRRYGSVAGRAAVLHALAHIEANAVNLALDAVHRFDAVPVGFAGDWLGVAVDEVRHFRWVEGRLREFGVAYGDLAGHDGLWSMARSTAHDLVERMALVPRFLEARGLDVGPPMADAFEGSGDAESAVIVRRITVEEEPHVALGDRWFRWACSEVGLDPTQTYLRLLRERRLHLAPPVNVDARRRVGFSDDELTAAPREGRRGSDGRHPRTARRI